MNARYLAVFSAISAISCSEAASSTLPQAGAAAASAATQNQPQPPSANAGAARATHNQGGAGISAAVGGNAHMSSAPAAANGGAPPPAARNVDPPNDAGPEDDAGAASDGSMCPDGFPRGTASTDPRKLLALKPSPEGVTMCPDGHVFLALDDGQIIRVDVDATTRAPWTTLTGIEPAGITCDEHNRLFVAVYAVRSGNTKPGVVRVDAQGGQGIMLPEPAEASPLAAYNGILAIAGLGVYATDSGAGWVVRTHEQSSGEYTTEIVARDIPIANGLAYDTTQHKLYVASSLDFAVYAFDLADDGSLQNRSKVQASSSSFFDGVAVDEHGEVYAADYSGNNLVRLSDGKVIAPVPTPASLAFRGGTLLITDYRLNQPEAEGGLYAVDLGACSGQRQ